MSIWNHHIHLFIVLFIYLFIFAWSLFFLLLDLLAWSLTLSFFAWLSIHLLPKILQICSENLLYLYHLSDSCSTRFHLILVLTFEAYHIGDIKLVITNIHFLKSIPKLLPPQWPSERSLAIYLSCYYIHRNLQIWLVTNAP